MTNFDLDEAFEEFVAAGGARGLLTRYNGSARVREELRLIGQHYSEELGIGPVDERHIVAFDGCHEALSAAIGLFTGTAGGGSGRDTVAFAVPGYPYWTIAAAGRHRSMPLRAFTFAEYLDRLEGIRSGDVAAVVVNTPSNPLGFSACSDEVTQLNYLAETRGWGIVADVTYRSFSDGLDSAAAFTPQRTIYCQSTSKAWGLPGLRLGFAYSTDLRLAVALRAVKSGRSLLPASLKVAFLSWLLTSRSDVPHTIREVVHSRKGRFRERFSGLGSMTSCRLCDAFTPGPYEVLELLRPNMPPDVVHDMLLKKDMKVFPDRQFFPPSWPLRSKQRFVRLSFGLTSDPVGAAVVLHEAFEGAEAPA